MPTYFYLRFQSLECGVAAGVNDVPLVWDPGGRGAQTTRPINEWIMPAGNRLTVFVSWPEEKPYQPGKSSIRAMVFIHKQGEDLPTPGTVLAELEWPTPKRPEGYPQVISLPLNIDQPPPTPLWTTATPIGSVSPADRQTMLTTIESFRAALLGNNAEAAFQFVEGKYRDDAVAYAKPEARNREIALDAIKDMMELRGRSSAPLTEADALFDIVANGRLVRVSRRGNENAIVIRTDEGMRIDLPVYFAQIGGKWQVAR
ncbi:MAG: hypothetical protein HRF50_12335 [Phycisphaerae bacterium]|jgi:hypothetical protein